MTGVADAYRGLTAVRRATLSRIRDYRDWYQRTGSESARDNLSAERQFLVRVRKDIRDFVAAYGLLLPCQSNNNPTPAP